MLLAFKTIDINRLISELIKQKLNVLLANGFSDADVQIQNSNKLQNAPNSIRQIKCWQQIHLKRE